MLRLGPLVVYPVEVTHRAVSMPRHERAAMRSDEASAMCHSVLGSDLVSLQHARGQSARAHPPSRGAA